MESSDILVAKESFTVDIDGVPTVFRGGETRVRRGHPVLEGREELFEPLRVHYDIETATTAKRASSVRRKKASAGDDAADSGG